MRRNGELLSGNSGGDQPNCRFRPKGRGENHEKASSFDRNHGRRDRHGAGGGHSDEGSAPDGGAGRRHELDRMLPRRRRRLRHVEPGSLRRDFPRPRAPHAVGHRGRTRMVRHRAGSAATISSRIAGWSARSPTGTSAASRERSIRSERSTPAKKRSARRGPLAVVSAIVVVPQLLTYVSGGYTQARFGQVDMTAPGVPVVGAAVISRPRSASARTTYSGWFLGSGVEYAIDFLPGLFWKTEYRYASYGAKDLPVFNTVPSRRPAWRSTPRSTSRPSAASWCGASTWRPRWSRGTDPSQRRTSREAPASSGAFCFGPPVTAAHRSASQLPLSGLSSGRPDSAKRTAVLLPDYIFAEKRGARLPA